MWMWMILSLLVGISAGPITRARPIWNPGYPCGVSKYADAGTPPPPHERIVGGQDVRPNEFPWQVSLRSPPGNDNQHFCGGSIINDTWIITAAHCVDGDAPGDLVVVVGEHDSADASNPTRAVHDLENIFVHETYGNTAVNYDNDIAVLKLTSPVAFSEDVVPVCAPEDAPFDYKAHQEMQISGWGTVQSGGICCPDVLKWTHVYTTTMEECGDAPNYDPSELTDNMICAGDEGSWDDRDTCQGDSGGPMTYRSATDDFEIVGLTSWGYGCASGSPGVYQYVQPHNEWVTAKITKN